MDILGGFIFGFCAVLFFSTDSGLVRGLAFVGMTIGALLFLSAPAA